MNKITKIFGVISILFGIYGLIVDTKVSPLWCVTAGILFLTHNR